ncbi:MAG: hypothetical protein QM817_38465 [Archangium sp.]
MTVLALALALTHGGLLADGYVHTNASAVRLIDSSMLEIVAGGVLAARGDDPLDALSLSQLQAERSMLEGQQRSLVAPIVLLAAGATSYIVGAVLAYIAYDFGVALVGVLLFIAGTALVVTGTILLISALVTNGKNSARMRRLDQRIAEMQGGGVGPVPTGGGEVPPPPPPPPVPPSTQNLLLPNQPQVVLANF